MYDHVRRQPLPEEQLRRFCTLWRFPDLETPESYVAAVQAAGLRLSAQDVTSASVLRFYTRLLTQYRERRAEFEAARGLARYQEGLERLRMSQQWAAAGLFTGVFWLLMGLTGAVTWIAKLTSRPVVHGIILGLGLGFILEGVRMMETNPALALLAAVMSERTSATSCCSLLTCPCGIWA